MDIKQINDFSENLLQRLNQLITQLDPSAITLSEQELRELIAAPSSHLFTASDTANGIIGCLTLAIYSIPTGKRAWIEDVVVDSESRGKGAAKLLVQAAIDCAHNLGVNSINLTSNPQRVAANALYQKTGFQQRETNVYRYSPKPPDSHS